MTLADGEKLYAQKDMANSIYLLLESLRELSLVDDGERRVLVEDESDSENKGQ